MSPTPSHRATPLTTMVGPGLELSVAAVVILLARRAQRDVGAADAGATDVGATAGDTEGNGAAAALLRQYRGMAFGVYGIGFAIYFFVVGFPTDIISVLTWLWVATMCWNVHRPARYHASFARDWAPVVVALMLYNFSRGWADNGQRPHVTEMLTVDRWLFHGHIPTLWLQQHFYDPAHVRWWDTVMSVVYLSHFLATPIIAVVLWVRDRNRWLWFVRRWMVLTVAGLATYFLFPAAPPWWAAREGYIPFVDRMSSRGWDGLGLPGTTNLLSNLQGLANPIAAMPSLHAGFSMLVALFLMSQVRRPVWRVLIAMYPVVMAISLVYSGEHWVTDTLVGWAYVGTIFILVDLAERAWNTRAAKATRLPKAIRLPNGSVRAGSSVHLDTDVREQGAGRPVAVGVPASRGVPANGPGRGRAAGSELCGPV